MNYTDLNAQEAAQTAEKTTLQSIEKKIDQLLDYQRRAHHWAIFRGVVSFLLFFVLVILPIIWTYSLFKTFAGQVDFGKLAEQYGQITQGLDQLDSLKTGGGLPNVSDLLNKVNP